MNYGQSHLKSLEQNPGSTKPCINIIEPIDCKPFSLRKFWSLGSDDKPFILNVKGFGSGIDYKTEENAEEKEKVMSLLMQLYEEKKALRRWIIVWDGDLYHDDSFTALIPDITQWLQHRDAELQVDAWVVLLSYDCISDFSRSWQSSQHTAPLLSINVTAWEKPIEACGSYDVYTCHGIKVLQATGSACVFSLGGGKVVREETEVLMCTASGKIQTKKHLPHEDQMNGKGAEFEVAEERAPVRQLWLMTDECARAVQFYVFNFHRTRDGVIERFHSFSGVDSP